jgi:hypothetical protein
MRMTIFYITRDCILVEMKFISLSFLAYNLNPFTMLKFCEDQGTILVETPSAYAKTEVTNYLNRTNTGLASTAQYWTGLKYNDTAMSFIWNATGTQFTSASFSDWYMNKTNSATNQS